jgi:hypothetical protein
MNHIARPIVIDAGTIRTRQDEDLLREVQRVLEAELMLGSCCIDPDDHHRSTPVLFTEGYDGRIAVSALDGVVTLSGEVASEGERGVAARLVWTAPGCRGLVNHLLVTAGALASAAQP